jgi:hypothetical protein
MEKISGRPDGQSDGGIRDELCIREPEDILAFIPHTMGEWPNESLVAVTVGAGSVGVTVRVDLPSGAVDAGAAQRTAHSTPSDGDYVAAIHDHLTSDVLADSCVLVVYTSRTWTDPCDPPWIDLVTTLGDDLAAAGIPVLDAWLVGRTHWRSMLCGDTLCCPWPGRPLQSIESSRLGAEMVYRGSSFEDALRPRVRTPASLPATAPDHDLAHSDAWWNGLAFAGALWAWEESLAGASIASPERLALLASSLTRPALRDAVLVAAALDAATAWNGSVAVGAVDPSELNRTPELPGLPAEPEVHRVREAAAAWSGAGCSDDETKAKEAVLSYGAVLLGGTRERPDWERIDRFERLLKQMSEREEPEVRAPVLALLGWVSWARGRGTRAAGYLRRALSAAPDYRFAELFSRIVESGEVAGWARRPETAWRPLGEAA